jgi:hypothetical protein
MQFLYPLPSYIASAFHALGASLVDSYKYLLAMGIVLSGITMFLWLRRVFGAFAGYVGGLLYALAPYRLVDVYVRGDIGENLAFIFLPLTLYCYDRFSTGRNHLWLVVASLSFGLLVISHNAIALFGVAMYIVYAGYLVWQSKQRLRDAALYCVSLMLGFGISAFFWIPGLLEGKYTLRNIVTSGVYVDRFISIDKMIWGPWSYGQTGEFTKQFGIFQWIGLIACLPLLFVLKKRSDPRWVLGAIALVGTAVSIYLMIPQSAWIYERVMLLQNFQFPWRFLGVVVVTSVVAVALCASCIPQRFQVAVYVLLCIGILFFQRDYFVPIAYDNKPESYFTGIYDSTTDTGESAPIWSVRFMLERPPAPIEVVDGKADISIGTRTHTQRDYVLTVHEKAYVVEHTLYFPGWVVEANGQSIPIEFQNQAHRGLITFTLEPGTYQVKIRFTHTRLRLVSDVLTAASIMAAGIWAGGYVIFRRGKNA